MVSKTHYKKVVTVCKFVVDPEVLPVQKAVVETLVAGIANTSTPGAPHARILQVTTVWMKTNTP